MEDVGQCPFCKKAVRNFNLHTAQCERNYQKQGQNNPIQNLQSQRNNPNGSQQMNQDKANQNESNTKPSKQPIFGGQNQSNTIKKEKKQPENDENIVDVESDEKKVPVIERPNGTMSYYHPLVPSQLAQGNSWMEDIKCPNCGEKLTMDTVANHVDTCQFREDPCQFCGQSFPLYLLQEHLDVCEKAQETYAQQSQRRSHIRSRIDNNNDDDRNNQQFQRNTQPIWNNNSRQGYPRQQQQQQQQQQRMEEVPPQFQPSSPFSIFDMLNNQGGQNVQRNTNRIFVPQERAPRASSNRMFQQRTFINGQEVFDQPQTGIRMNGIDVSSLLSRNRNGSEMGPDPFQMLMAALILGRNGNSDPSNNGGLSEAQMKEFPEHEFHQQSGLNPDQCKCTICMSDFEENEKVKILDCMHSYHSECIDTWLKKNTKCPVCKKDMREFV